MPFCVPFKDQVELVQQSEVCVAVGALYADLVSRTHFVQKNCKSVSSFSKTGHKSMKLYTFVSQDLSLSNFTPSPHEGVSIIVPAGSVA